METRLQFKWNIWNMHAQCSVPTKCIRYRHQCHRPNKWKMSASVDFNRSHLYVSLYYYVPLFFCVALRIMSVVVLIWIESKNVRLKYQKHLLINSVFEKEKEKEEETITKSACERMRVWCSFQVQKDFGIDVAIILAVWMYLNWIQFNLYSLNGTTKNAHVVLCVPFNDFCSYSLLDTILYVYVCFISWK